MSDTLIEYAIDGSQPRMRTSEQELRTSERAHNEALAQLAARREGRQRGRRASISGGAAAKSEIERWNTDGGESPAAV